MLDLLKLTQDYFVAFSNKDIDTLNKLYHENVVLDEWGENIFDGKDKVLEENRKLFESCEKVSVEIVSQGMDFDKFNKVTLNEITVWIDGSPVNVVDVIYFGTDGLIEEIRAFRGF